MDAPLVDLVEKLYFRGSPELSSFTSMTIPIIRGGRGLENDDNYLNFCSMSNMFFGWKKKGGYIFPVVNDTKQNVTRLCLNEE